MLLGTLTEAARGLQHYMRVSEDHIRQGASMGIAAIVEEVTARCTAALHWSVGLERRVQPLTAALTRGIAHQVPTHAHAPRAAASPGVELPREYIACSSRGSAFAPQVNGAVRRRGSLSTQLLYYYILHGLKVPSPLR